MNLYTKEQFGVLVANGREYLRNPEFDPKPVIKLFTPDANCTYRFVVYKPSGEQK